MKQYQPALFVGLGGTGCLVGAELERRFRAELCGPDGTDLRERMVGMDFLPYQLPSSIQMVYADLNEAQLTRLSHDVVPAAGHDQAVDRTTQVARGLVPRHDTYPEVARSLRINAGAAVEGWLPPSTGEPRVAPLARGAGQLPTVGRAALMETFRGGIGPAQEPIRSAIGKLAKAGGELMRLGGRMRGSCDVFVAFSVAGGTGSGIFYDYLHLIGDAIERAGLRAQIYPLVVMPSAFGDGMGGGRPAQLNAGRALLDLFRLVDDQNGQVAGPEVDDIGASGALSVRYPGGLEIRLRASTVQTAFLFSRTAGMERDDLHRSIVSLVLSLIGTSQEASDEHAAVADREYQSFADEFINGAVAREVSAPSGLGNCGVSTSLVASMTVPADDLADIVSSRLLAEAVTELSAPPPGAAEANRELIERAFGLANIDSLRTRSPQEFTEPAVPSKGSEAVLRALATRGRTMEAGLDALERRLGELVPKLAQDFDPRRAADQLLGEADLFRLHRIMVGHRDLRDVADQKGFLGLLEGRRRDLTAPAGLAVNPPQPGGELRNRVLHRLRWADKAVRDAIDRQNTWYAWRGKQAWHAAWADQTPRWERKAADLRKRLDAIIDAFTDHVQSDASRFTRRAQDLSRGRTGVSYLLPPHGTDLEPFYKAVVRRFRAHYVEQDRLSPTATVADILNVVAGGQTWQSALAAGLDDGPEQAVAVVRHRLKQEVLRLFRRRNADEGALLPTLADLLLAAAGKEGTGVGDEDVQQFRQKLAALVPAGFDPQGAGPLKALISYAAAGRDPDLESFLRREIHLPRTDGVVEFRPIDAESIVVVLFRTSMSVTEVPEVRGVLSLWADAQRREEPHDYLRWRQRLGYDYDYLISTEEHRVHILHRFLCALWNDQVTVVDGDPLSPKRIAIRPGNADAAEISLALTEFDRTSSWASVLRAYELWVLKDDQRIRRDIGSQLTTALPRDVDGSPRPPAELYRTFRKIAQEQEAVTAEVLESLPTSSVGLARTRHSFWSKTYPAALDLPFRGVSNPVRATLRELEQAVHG
jgi:hypothetical protein